MVGYARYFFLIVIAALFVRTAAPAMALDASELALVVNRNVLEGEKLAELYAKQRQVPDHRIIELDLPTAEQMPFETYERDVVPPIREFLRINDPQNRVKCLVTFYGVPFRIAAHTDTPEEIAELKELHLEARAIGGSLKSLTDQLEKLAALLDSSFKPDPIPPSIAATTESAELSGPAVEALARLVNQAGKSIVLSIQKMADPAAHQAAEAQLFGIVQSLDSPIQVNDTSAAKSTTESITPAASDPLLAAMPLEDRRFDPAARAAFRKNSAKTAGLFGYMKVVLAQIGYLSPEDTESATDSELSLLRWTFYPRPKWQLNTLCYRFATGATSPSLMVSRLDAPTPEIVRQMILSSIHAESQGLQGRMVIDARGLPLDGPGGKPDSYALFDETLRKLAALIRAKTTLKLTFDDNPAVLPAHSVQDVALYCGWYSVGKYVPACSFVPGAVGFHVASFEMVSLRDRNNTGWVRGLLNDGIAATLGPVSEPYLQSFPPPDEFFPLLLTGRLTLAEVYWKTELMASWRQCLVGDPLYTPFKVNPQMKVADLPDRLQAIFHPPTPATAPAAAPH
jgi:uncharacterized protein (TIGR03790 family)